jgi:hypothetical protein
VKIQTGKRTSANAWEILMGIIQSPNHQNISESRIFRFGTVDSIQSHQTENLQHIPRHNQSPALFPDPTCSLQNNLLE